MAEEPDKGRAWLVAVAALVINMVMAGIFRAQGILFVEFINMFRIDRKTAAVPFSVRTSIRNLLAPIVGIMGQKYGARSIVIIGGILGTLSSVLCFFASDIGWIIITWGAINGIASSLITVLPQVVITQYFIKHQTTAMGIASSGGCMGSLVLPAIFDTLIYKYGLNGTFFIIAGLILHTIPAAMILKAPPWLNDNRNQHSSSVSQKIIDTTPPNNAMYNKALSTQKRECGVQVGNDKIDDIFKEEKAIQDEDCQIHQIPRSSSISALTHVLRSSSCNGLTDHLFIPRSNSYSGVAYKRPLPRMSSYGGLSHQMHIQQSVLPTISSVGVNFRTNSSNFEPIFDIDMDYLKKNCDLVFHMLSMEIPNLEISYRAIFLEVEQDELWHPEKTEIMQEIESIYCHIEKFLEIDQISIKSGKPNGIYLKRTLLSGALTINKRSESLRAVKRYLRTYKERGLQTLGKIRSAPNMSNIYNELARKDYVISKLKQLCSCNEIRIISHLSQYNPKDVLKVLFQVRALYKMYSDLESCDQCESSDFCESVETGDIASHRKDSGLNMEVTPRKVSEQTCEKDLEQACKKCPEETRGKVSNDNSFRVHIKAAIDLHKNGIFLLLCITRTIFYVSFNPLITIIVDLAMDKGLQEEDGKFVIGALSFGDLLGRTCLGWITDRGYVCLPRYMTACMVMLSICIASIPFMHTKWTIFISIALFGTLQGSLFIRHPCLVAKYLRPLEQSIAVGCMEFSSGIICLFLPLYIGYFRDVVGSYDTMFYINGVLVLLTGICWLFEPCLVKINNRKVKNILVK